MNKIVRGGLAAAAVVAATIALAAPAQAYTPPAGHKFGEYVGVTTGAGAITEVDMNVGESNQNWYHEYDLTYVKGADGVITFEGVGKQFDNNGESITGVIDTINRKLTFVANYYTGSAPDGRVWEITNGLLGPISESGFADWEGDWNGVHWTGSILIPQYAHLPVAGNHGEYVSGAAKAGIKGKDLAAIAKDGSLVGPYKG